jgi:hypothetical protein
MRWNATYQPRGLPNIYHMSLHFSRLPLYPSMSLLPTSSPSSLHLQTVVVAQSTAKLIDGGGKIRIFLPQFLWSNQSHQSLNNFKSCLSGNSKGISSWLCIISVLVAILCRNNIDILPAPSCKWVTLECQWFVVFQNGHSKWWMVADSYNWSIGHRYRIKRKRHTLCPSLNVTINKAPMIIALGILPIDTWFGSGYTYSYYWQPL